MLEIANRVFLALLMLAALAGIILSLAALFLPDLLGDGSEYRDFEHMAVLGDFSLRQPAEEVHPDDSPYRVDISILTPPLKEGDLLVLDIYSDGKSLYEIDCLEDFEAADNYAGMTALDCTAYLPYNYVPRSTYRIFGVFSRDGTEYAAGPVIMEADWHDYDSRFIGFSTILGAAIAAIYLFIVLPIGILALRSALRTRHGADEEPGLGSLLNPLSFGKTFLQKFHAFLVSPYFWAFELAGILLIIIYVALAGEAWKSAPAFVAFVFSGLVALIIPFLWCIAWWYADIREREPLRMIVTFFLWGMLAALMAIGLNTAADIAFGIFGLSVLATFLVAPVVEEFYKGSGLCLLSEHHEFDSVEDGIAFGFVIGMGFSFIENWIYFIGNPLGSDTLGWFFVFLMRSVFFSANHGLYTAITGGIIGYLIERKFRAPALGILAGFPIAAFFHAMHNSGPAIISMLGLGGVLIYCCFLIPVFDYGGFIVLLLFFIRAIIRQKP